jgi:hypothetical protein
MSLPDLPPVIRLVIGLERWQLAMAAIDFEREELLDEMNEPPQSGGAQRCGYAHGCIRRFKEENDTLGDGLMSVLEKAEEVAQNHSAEGYYLETANQLQVLSGCRTRMFNAFNDLVAHHQRAGPMGASESEARVFELRTELGRLRGLLDSNERRVNLLYIREQQALERVKQVQDESFLRIDNLKASLEKQFKSRYENKEAELYRKLRTQEEVISGDQILIASLREDLKKTRQQAKTSKSLISFLNKRVREAVKSARGGSKKKQSRAEPKCHILGTYDDVLGATI